MTSRRWSPFWWWDARFVKAVIYWELSIIVAIIIKWIIANFYSELEFIFWNVRWTLIINVKSRFQNERWFSNQFQVQSNFKAERTFQSFCSWLNHLPLLTKDSNVRIGIQSNSLIVPFCHHKLPVFNSTFSYSTCIQKNTPSAKCIYSLIKVTVMLMTALCWWLCDGDSF